MIWRGEQGRDTPRRLRTWEEEGIGLGSSSRNLTMCVVTTWALSNALRSHC